MIELTPEEKLLLAVAKIHPTADELKALDALVIEVIDWEKVCTTLIDRGFAPLFYKKIPLLTNAQHIPDAVQQKLKKTYYLTFSRSALMYEQFYAIMNAFAAAGIDVIPLKGIFLVEWLYQDYGLRQMSDIDLLVRKKDAKKALSVLDEIGFNVYDGVESELVGGQSDRVHYKPRIKANISVEVHEKVHHENETYSISSDHLFKNAVEYTLKDTTVRGLDIYDLLIHLCVHLDKHFNDLNSSMKSFIDIVNLIDTNENLDWEQLAQRCKTYKCTDIVFNYILLCNSYFGVKLPQQILSKHRIITSKEILFLEEVKGLNNKPGNQTSLLSHSNYIKSENTILTKIVYVFRNLFPLPAFMIKKYHIKSLWLVPFYYFYRWWLGIKGVYIVIIKK